MILLLRSLIFFFSFLHSDFNCFEALGPDSATYAGLEHGRNDSFSRPSVMVDPARAPGRERSSSVPSWHEIVPTGCYNRRDF